MSDLSPRMDPATRRTRPRGFAPWTPRPASLALVQDVRAVLADYGEHLPLTIRQVFYRLVATRGFDKTEAAYSRLCEIVNRARRAGLTVQCEALDPVTLAGNLRDAITARRDYDAVADLMEVEADMRAALVEKLGAGQ